MVAQAVGTRKSETTVCGRGHTVVSDVVAKDFGKNGGDFCTCQILA